MIVFRQPIENFGIFGIGISEQARVAAIKLTAPSRCSGADTGQRRFFSACCLINGCRKSSVLAHVPVSQLKCYDSQLNYSQAIESHEVW